MDQSARDLIMRKIEMEQEQEQIAHAQRLRADRERITDAGRAMSGEVNNQASDKRAMCARETARSLIINNISRLDRERAGLVALLDVLHPNMHQFAPQADEALFEMVSRRR